MSIIDLSVCVRIFSFCWSSSLRNCYYSSVIFDMEDGALLFLTRSSFYFVAVDFILGLGGCWCDFDLIWFDFRMIIDALWSSQEHSTSIALTIAVAVCDRQAGRHALTAICALSLSLSSIPKNKTMPQHSHYTLDDDQVISKIRIRWWDHYSLFVCTGWTKPSGSNGWTKRTSNLLFNADGKKTSNWIEREKRRQN